MASIKNLKKDINYVLEDIIQECYNWELENPTADTKNSQAIVDESIIVFDGLIEKLHTKDVENAKAHFKAIGTELEVSANKLLEKINKL